MDREAIKLEKLKREWLNILRERVDELRYKLDNGFYGGAYPKFVQDTYELNKKMLKDLEDPFEYYH